MAMCKALDSIEVYSRSSVEPDSPRNTSLRLLGGCSSNAAWERNVGRFDLFVSWLFDRLETWLCLSQEFFPRYVSSMRATYLTSLWRMAFSNCSTSIVKSLIDDAILPCSDVYEGLRTMFPLGTTKSLNYLYKYNTLLTKIDAQTWWRMWSFEFWCKHIGRQLLIGRDFWQRVRRRDGKFWWLRRAQ